MLHACLLLFCAAGARVGYCWWGCCVFTVPAVVVLSCIPMLVGSALLWSKITPEFFEIARSYNDVVCRLCECIYDHRSCLTSCKYDNDFCYSGSVHSWRKAKSSWSRFCLFLCCFIDCGDYSHCLRTSLVCIEYEYCGKLRRKQSIHIPETDFKHDY